MQNIDKNKLFSAVLNSFGGKISKSDLDNLSKGNAANLINNLNANDRAKINELLNDKQKLMKTMQSEEFKNILNRFSKGGNNNG